MQSSRNLVLALAVAAGLSCASSAQAAGKLQVGQPAPEFRVTTFDGRVLTSSDYKGKVLLVNFWATWCAPCRTEMPLIDAYYQVQKKYGFEVVAVTTEDEVPRVKLKPLADLLHIQLAKGFRGAAYGKVKAVPTNYVIDRAGVLRYAKPGAFNLDELNALLIPMLQEPVPEPAAAIQPPSAS